MYLDTGIHLTYCTNIHPGETWKETFQALKDHVPAIRSSEPFGLGLRLSGVAAAELVRAPDQIEEFRTWLREQGCYVFTMNGFPYGQFHNTTVKDRVHAPDWLSEERVKYTCDLADILVQLLGNLDEGGISTSPVSYRFWHKDTDMALRQALPHFFQVVQHLHKLYTETGKVIHIDIEPEPDGLLENADEFIRFYTEFLLSSAREQLPGISDPEEVVRRHVQLCYDVCHFSVEFEEGAGALNRILQANIPVGKVQISAALKVSSPGQESYDLLAAFDEPTYLHQAVGKKHDTLIKYRDLPVLLAERPPLDEVRCHFHVPIFTREFSGLQSTQEDVITLLKICKDHPFTNHLEVETYTWQVLPSYLSLNMDEAIQRELAWVKEQWTKL